MPVGRKSSVKMDRGKEEEFNAQAFYTLFTSSPVWCREKCQSKRRIQRCERPKRSAWNCQRESFGFTCEKTSWWSIADNFQEHAPNSTSLIREQVHPEVKDSWHYRAPATTNRRKANKFLRTPGTGSEDSFRDGRRVVEVIETPFSLYFFLIEFATAGQEHLVFDSVYGCCPTERHQVEIDWSLIIIISTLSRSGQCVSKT